MGAQSIIDPAFPHQHLLLRHWGIRFREYPRPRSRSAKLNGDPYKDVDDRYVLGTSRKFFTSSAILVAMSTIGSSAVLNPFREASRGLTSRRAS
jgi:hypothetical protein